MSGVSGAARSVSGGGVGARLKDAGSRVSWKAAGPRPTT